MGGDFRDAFVAVAGFDFVDMGVALDSGFLLSDLEGVRDS